MFGRQCIRYVSPMPPRPPPPSPTPLRGDTAVRVDGFTYLPRFITVPEADTLAAYFASHHPVWEKRYADGATSRRGGSGRLSLREINDDIELTRSFRTARSQAATVERVRSGPRLGAPARTEGVDLV